MSDSLIEQHTAEPTSKRADSSQTNSQKHSSQSPTSKTKKPKTDHTSNIPSTPKRQMHGSPKTNSPLNGQKPKSKEIGIAASPKENSKKATTTKSIVSNQVMVGTPTKHKLIERTNSIDVPQKRSNKTVAKESVATANTLSPRKTRSKASKIVEATAAIKAKTKLKLPQLDGAHDDDKKSKQRTRAKSRPKPDHETNSDSDFEPSQPKRIYKPKITPSKPVNKALDKTKRIDRRVLSTDVEFEEDTNTVRMNFWIEAYAETEKKWITIDPVKKKVDCVDYVRVSKYCI